MSYLLKLGEIKVIKIEKLENDTNLFKTVYLPQIELIKYNPVTKECISRDFEYIKDDNQQPKEFETEVKALQSAIDYRNLFYSEENNSSIDFPPKINLEPLMESCYIELKDITK